MVGAKEEKLCTEASKYLSHMGKNIAFCGPVGHGQIAKVCNNMMLGISMIAASETLEEVREGGFNLIFGQSWVLQGPYWVISNSQESIEPNKTLNKSAHSTYY
jgi:3-hydroxyisobutyrate dehydrogenase-like beta-hydroxyacid dehydrogenase